ncbi:MAG: hypothetical protein J6A85_08680 [Clostridia bacterium]|nr:hypothetical protein [Clostridia bacterium]
MRKLNKTFVCLLLVLFCLSSCSHASDNEIIDNDNYTIATEDDICYLHLKKNFSDAYSYENMAPYVMHDLSFKSISELYSKIKNNGFTEYQLAHIQKVFTHDESGRVIVCDINKLFVPALPEQGSVGKVYWGGADYSYSLQFSDNVHGFFICSVSEIFNQRYQTGYVDYIDNSLFTLGETKTVSDRNATEYYYTTSQGSLKAIQYTLESGNKKIFVCEKYALELNHDLGDVSDTVPYQIDLFIFDENNTCEILLYDFTSRPTEEWLLSFGMEPYVPEDTATE